MALNAYAYSQIRKNTKHTHKKRDKLSLSDCLSSLVTVTE